MASTLTKLLVHITFSTKNREAIIPESIEPDLYSYIGGICRRMDSPLLAMGGAPDHVHMMISLGKTTALSSLMLEVKRDSSKWVKLRDESLEAFSWQDCYFAFSIGASAADALRSYIATQKEHHRVVEFKDEIRTFLKKYGVEWANDMFGSDAREQPFGLRDDPSGVEYSQTLSGGVARKLAPPPATGDQPFGLKRIGVRRSIRLFPLYAGFCAYEHSRLQMRHAVTLGRKALV